MIVYCLQLKKPGVKVQKNNSFLKFFCHRDLFWCSAILANFAPQFIY